ncbi:MAG: type II toxin-antitoxin system VapC family toxin [Desulfococcaceae bacterium]
MCIDMVDTGPQKASDVCRRIDDSGCFVSSIFVWEIGIKIKKGKLEIGTSFTDYVNRLHFMQQIEIVPVDEYIWLENINLAWIHREPAGRKIVAIAKRMKLQIVTADEIIRVFW